MGVTERLMRPGDWSLRLRDDTPKNVRTALAFFGHVLIANTKPDIRGLSGANALSLARYTGILRTRTLTPPYEIGGPGLVAWLGDEDDKGEVIEAAMTKAAATFSAWITDLLPASITAGTITSPAGTLTHTVQYMTPRKAIDYVCDYFGAEYRVNPTGTLDAGTAANLFVTNPTAVVMRRGQGFEGGRDLNVTGIPGEVTVKEDAEDYSTRVVVLASGEGTAIATGLAGAATSYLDLHGNAVVLTRMVDSPNTEVGNENTLASQQLGRFSSSRLEVTLSADLYDIGRSIKVGDTIWVYDPDGGLVDTTQQVTYRGQVIHPQKLRVYGSSWPVEEGMGVWYRSGAGVFTDLTEWVEFESSTAKLEVGTARRRLLDAGVDQDAVTERVSR